MWFEQDGARLLDRHLNCVRVLQPPDPSWAQSDPEGVALLAKETTDAGTPLVSGVLTAFLPQAQLVLAAVQWISWHAPGKKVCAFLEDTT